MAGAAEAGTGRRRGTNNPHDKKSPSSSTTTTFQSENELSLLVKGLSLEVHVLQLWVHRNANQHRRAPFHRRLKMVLRALQKSGLEDGGLLQEICCCRAVPDTTDVVVRLYERLQHLRHVLSRLRFAAESLWVELSRGFFVAPATVALAACSRLYVLIQRLGQEGTTVWNQAQRCHNKDTTRQFSDLQKIFAEAVTADEYDRKYRRLEELEHDCQMGLGGGRGGVKRNEIQADGSVTQTNETRKKKRMDKSPLEEAKEEEDDKDDKNDLGEAVWESSSFSSRGANKTDQSTEHKSKNSKKKKKKKENTGKRKLANTKETPLQEPTKTTTRTPTKTTKKKKRKTREPPRDALDDIFSRLDR